MKHNGNISVVENRTEQPPPPGQRQRGSDVTISVVNKHGDSGTGVEGLNKQGDNGTGVERLNR